MSDDARQRFTLGEWTVIPLQGQLRDGDRVRRLTPRAVDVLLLLARSPLDVVSKEALLAEAWGGRAMSDAPLTKVIAELRRELGDDRQSPRFIETIPKRGYRLLLAPQYAGRSSLPAATARTGWRWWPTAAVLALIAVVSALGLRASRPSPPPWTEGANTLAVLPFDVIDDSASLASFAAGMHEEIVAQLSGKSVVAVMPRRSTLAYHGSTQSLTEIGAELGASLLVDGSVRLDGEQLRVRAELVWADTSSQIWSRDFERDLSVAGVFAVQQQIAADIAALLAADAADAAEAADAPAPAATETPGLPTRNYEAYEQWLLGKYHYRRQLPGDIELAIAHLEQAVAADPVFAEAWDWLAYAYNHAATSLSTMAPNSAYNKGRAAALRALDLDPELHTARAILGYIRAVYEWDWDGAENDLRQAVAGDPHDTGTVWSLAHVLSMRAKHAEAIALVRTVADASPGNGRLAREVANRLVDARRFSDALPWVDRAEANGDEPTYTHSLRAAVLFGLGRYSDALSEAEAAVRAGGKTATLLGQQAIVHAALGNDAAVQRLLASINALSDDVARNDPVTLAAVYASWGRSAEALSWLETAASRRDRAVLTIHLSPIFDTVLATERGRGLLATLGVPSAPPATP